MTTKPLTPQKLYALFRKHGYTAAKWDASGMVRGWGDWTSGVKINKDSDTNKLWFVVTYYRSSRSQYDTQLRKETIQRLAKILSDANIAYAEWDNGLELTVQQEQ